MNTQTRSRGWNLETQLISEALGGLEASTGIVGQTTSHDADSGGMVTLHVAGTRLDYVCQVKRNVDRLAYLDDIKARSSPGENTLLVCNALTNAMATHCHKLDIQFIDTAGNAFLTNHNGILIKVTGRKRDKGAAPSADKTITPAALRMMFAFLAQPSMLNASYRDISTSVQVSTGAIGNALEVLETRGFIGTTPYGRRIINSPELMLSEWATGYTSRLKPKLRKLRFNAPGPADLLSQWTPEMRSSAWGGEVAAENLTKHLNPSTFTIYMDMEHFKGLPEMVKRFKLRADPNGPIELVQAFWNMDYFFDQFPNVPLHLTYADLLGTNDSRNLAVAKQVYTQVIDYVHRSQR
jgi:hypothetical protein